MAKDKGSKSAKSGKTGKVKDAAIIVVTGAVIAGAAAVEGVQRVVTGRDPNQPQG